MIDQEDSILVRQCLEGNSARFGELVKKYTKPIFNLALRMMNDRENAADITQITFTKAFENLRTFDLNLKFFSWLYRIAINEALNFLNKYKQTDQLSDDLLAAEPTPEEKMHEVQRNEIIQSALMKLSPEQRSVIVLRHFTDQTYAEISAALGITEAKVKSRLFSARHRLRGLLANRGL